jgi:hypothetical protein
MHAFLAERADAVAEPHVMRAFVNLRRAAHDDGRQQRETFNMSPFVGSATNTSVSPVRTEVMSS